MDDTIFVGTNWGLLQYRIFYDGVFSCLLADVEAILFSIYRTNCHSSCMLISADSYKHPLLDLTPRRTRHDEDKIDLQGTPEPLRS